MKRPFFPRFERERGGRRRLGRTIRGAGVALVVAAFNCFQSEAADKSGVSPNTISLPKGPGSIEGLGESFQPSLNTGTAKYGLSFKLAPGVAGHAPGLSLSYEGGGGNGPLGYGWSLPTGFIQRRSDQGIPTYGVDVGFPREDKFINEQREELVPQASGFYFCKNEGAFIRYQQISNHWEGTLPDGTRMEFGLTSSGRIEDSVAGHVFSWLLERQTDTRGNVILYAYRSFPGETNQNQKYLSGIQYGPGAPPWTNYHFVRLEYEDRSDWFEDCRSGFIVRTGKRLKAVWIGTQGVVLPGHLPGDFDGDGQPDYLDRRYDLGYLNYAGTNSHWSLLGMVTPVGADGVSTLPGSTFGYAVCDPPDLLSASDKIIGSTNEPPVVMDNELAELVDLNGDGLPDILKTDFGGGAHQAFLNRGEVQLGSTRAIQWDPPIDVDPNGGTAWNFNLSSTSTHLADMDGDGLADLVNKSAAGDVFYFRNLGHSAWGQRQDMSVQDSPPPAPFGQTDVRTADLDFDKRMDVVQSISGGLAYRIWFNLGDQTYSPSVTVDQDTGFSFADPTVQITDCNGDRVPDIAQVHPLGVVVTAGLGYGHFAPPISMFLPDHTLDDTQVAKAKLTDLNGDGLADLVIERAAPGECWYWLNLGNYTFSNRKVITGLPTGIGLNAVVRWADLNGNGSTDLVYADHDSSPRIQVVDLGELLACDATPNILTTINNGIGRVTAISYQPSTAFALADAAAGTPWPDLMPMPVSVVSSVTTSDSLGHQYVTQFRYHDGYYDAVEKQFRGFGRAEQIDVGDASAPTLVTRSYFDTGHQYEVMKGKLLRLTTEQEDGKVFSDATTTWTIPPVILTTGTNGTNVSYAHPVASQTQIEELGQGTPRMLESEMDYDNYGNQTRQANYGIVVNGDRSAFNDERITTTEYAVNTNAWILHHPARQEIQDENGVVISRMESYYDDETFGGNNLGEVNIGNLTLTRSWITPSNSAAYVNPTRAKYDLYGNPVTLLDPLAVAPGGTVDLTQGHTRQIIYDDQFHSYPVRETIHVGNGSADLVFQAGYDQGFGTAIRSLDFNQNQTSYAYDVFARLSNLVKPYDTSAYPTAEYDYFPAVPFGADGVINYVESRQLDKTPGSAATKRDHYLISRSFTDGLGRVLMTKHEAEPAPGSSVPRVVVNGAVLFNARQKPVRTLNPYFTLQTGAALDDLLGYENIEDPAWVGSFHENGQLVNLDLASAQQTTVTYDASLRSVQVTNPDGTVSRTVFEPLVTKSYDENDTDPASPFYDTPTVQFSDGLGRAIRTDETTRLNTDGTPAGQLNTWTTSYEYDLNDQLTRITDSQDNVKTIVFDGLKRKTSMNDLDSGTVSYTYDAASNLKATVDAKGQLITYTYDGANRILSEDYHDEGLPFSANFSFDPSQPISRANRPDVAYFYDAPVPDLPLGDGTIATAANTRGTLAYVWDLSGEEHTSFDSRGRIAWTVKRVPDPLLQSSNTSLLQLVSYQTAFQYDSLDRVTTMIYPDNDQVGYEYNERNLVKRIIGGPSGSILSNLVFTPSGQQQQLDYGNGVRTTDAYDNRQRLTHLQTVSQPATLNTHIIDFAYTFDGVSNIKSIADQRDTSVVPASDPRRNSQTFAYDDLYRLTRVQYNLPAPATANGGEINYRYDRIGNMLSQTSDIQQFEKGFSVTQLGAMSYGGPAGASGRTGRAPTDPPGPHALTGVSQSSTNNSQPRAYGYDANGNMTNIDGLICTWDFKDRLVAVEDDTMRAKYTYDYTDHRITKRVWSKSTTNSLSTLDSKQSAVVYANNSFEVRDHDQPTKYVFDGAVRVASVIGSLSHATRVQRLRLQPGWNLVSIAVGGASLPAIPQLVGSYQWNQVTGDYSAVIPGQPLAAGTVLWINAQSDLVLSLTGTYADPADRAIAAGGSYLAGTGLEAWSPAYPAGVLAWTYNAQTGRWSTRFDAELASESDPPSVISPGGGVYLKANTPLDLQTRDPTLRIRYYHEDHLGSSSVITDASGALVEENAFYAFGHPHNQYMPRQIHEPYQFTQKERDQESSLHYFEARFYAATIGRWLSCDSAGTEAGLNPYRFVKNNPARLIDPTGHDDVNPGMLQAAAYGMHCNPGSGFNWKSMAAASPDFGTALNSVCTTTPRSPDTWKNKLASASAGVGDALSFIVDTEQMRKNAGISIVDENSGWYIGGRITGCAVNTYAGSKAGNPTESEAPGQTSTPTPWSKTVYDPPAPEPVTLPGVNPAGTFNNYAVSVAARAQRNAADWKAAVNQSPRMAWIQATVDATRDYRSSLPTLQQQADAFRSVVEASDAVFGIKQ